MASIKEDISKIPIFFILGRGRSGSTLLRSMLDVNPNITIPFESRFVQYLYYKYGKVKNWNEEEIIKFYNSLINCYETPDFDKELLKNELLNLAGKANFSSLCKTAYLCIRSVFEKSAIRIIGDKNPRYTFFAKKLLDIFPEAKFIHLTRDYRDSTISFYNVKGMTSEKKNAAFLAFRWKYYNREILKFKAKHTSLFYTIKYEDLISFPENKLKEICIFLGVDYHQNMMNFQGIIKQHIEKNREEKFHQLHSGLLQPLNKDKVGIWKTEMHENDVRISDAIVGNYADKLGYERQFNSKSIFLKLTNFKSILDAWMPVYSKKLFYNSPFIMNIFYRFKKN